jgi:hypothetical protein
MIKLSGEANNASKVSYDVEVRDYYYTQHQNSPAKEIIKMIQKKYIYLTFTICGAEASADMPRQQSRATSAAKASQTPSLQITSRPPPVDS